MTEDEQAAQANAGAEGANELGDGGSEGVALEDDTDDTQSGGEDQTDPLDEIEDIDELRKETKKFRSIAQRKGKPAAKPAAGESEEREAPRPTVTDTVSKKDLYRINSRKAVKAAKALEPEIEANWDAISKLYVNRKGQEDPDDIVEDIKDAHAVWKSRNPAKEGADASELARSTSDRRSSSKPIEKTGERTTTSRRQPSTPMTEWYKKKA